MLKALSLSRPWTRLVLECGKDVENRTWSTPYRGPLIIHGAKSWDGPAAADLAEENLRGAPLAFAELRHLKELHPTGYLGVVDLVSVCNGECFTCGLWSMKGCHHWKLRNPRSFPEPIDGPGRLGLFDPSPEALAAFEALTVSV